MARRPEVFDKERFKDALRYAGCPFTFVDPTISTFRLIVPLIIRELGSEKLLEILSEHSEELSLGKSTNSWNTSIQYIVNWAEIQIEEYKSQK